MAKEMRSVIRPENILNMLVTCCSCDREVALPIDANILADLKCIYCCQKGFFDRAEDIRKFQAALRKLSPTLRIEIREPQE